MLCNYTLKNYGEIKQKLSQMEFFVEKHDLQNYLHQPFFKR